MINLLRPLLHLSLSVVVAPNCFVIPPQEFGVEDVIQGQFIMRHFKSDLIKMILSYLVPSKVRWDTLTVLYFLILIQHLPLLVSVAICDLEYFCSPLDGMQVHRMGYFHQISLPVPIYTLGWRLERDNVRVKSIAKHNAMFPVRAKTWTAQSRDKSTNHEATTPFSP